MKQPIEDPPRIPGETAHYEDDPFELGAIDDAQLIEVVQDFLPRPEELVFKHQGRKVTIMLDEKSIAFFKAQAEQLQVPYQRMIRNLLSEYVERHQAAKSPSA